MASESTPFYVGLESLEFREFARAIPLMEDELLMLESYARYAAESGSTVFSTARVTDFLLTRGQDENLAKLKTLPNVRRLISQTAFPLREKKFIDMDIDGGEVMRIRLTDPASIVIEDYYSQMLSNSALPFPDEEMLQKFLLPQNHIAVPVSEISSGTNHRLKEEKRLIIFRFNEVAQGVCATAATIDILLEVCLLKLQHHHGFGPEPPGRRPGKRHAEHYAAEDDDRRPHRAHLVASGK